MFVEFLLLSVVSTAVGLQVSIPKPEYEVARDDNVTLPCTFKPAKPDNPLIIVTWTAIPLSETESPVPVGTFYFPGNHIDIKNEYAGRANIKTDVPSGKTDLILTRVTLQENMKFECDVKIPDDDEGKTLATTRLVVLVAPSKPMCKIQGTAEYGQNINLTCISAEGSPQPTYSWQRHNVQNIPQPLPAKATDKNGLLSLYNVSMETSGYYICTSRNKIRSEICNLTLTVMPPSMNIGSTAGIIGGSVAALLVLLIVIYCCCCRKKEQPEEYGVPEEVAFTDKEPIQKQGDPRDDRSERSYDRRDRREEGSEVNGSTIDRRERYDDRGSDYSDRRDRYDDRRDRYDDRRDDYDDRRDRYDDRRDRYDDRRDRYDDRRDDYDDHRERYDDRRDRYDDRRDDYDDRSERYDDHDRPPSVPPNKPKRTDYD